MQTSLIDIEQVQKGKFNLELKIALISKSSSKNVSKFLILNSNGKINKKFALKRLNVNFTLQLSVNLILICYFEAEGNQEIDILDINTGNTIPFTQISSQEKYVKQGILLEGQFLAFSHIISTISIWNFDTFGGGAGKLITTFNYPTDTHQALLSINDTICLLGRNGFSAWRLLNSTEEEKKVIRSNHCLVFEKYSSLFREKVASKNK